MISVVHIADTHLDTPFRDLPAGVAQMRRQAIRNAFAAALTGAGEQGVRVVLLPGDLFDNGEATGESVRLLSAIAAKYPSTEFFVAPGNHDCLYGTSPYRYLSRPDNLHIFETGGIEKLDFEDFTVYGVGCLHENSEEQPLAGFCVEDPSRINLMCIHSQVQGFGGHQVYQPITLDQIAASGLDYLALGHVHTYSGLRQAGNTYYAYPGTLVGRGFDETGEKGYLVGQVGKGMVDLTFVSTPVGSFETLEVDISGAQSMMDVLSRVRGRLASADPELLLKLVLVGYRPTHLLLHLPAIRQEAGVAFVKVVDKTRLAPDHEQLLRENTLTGLYLRRVLQDSDVEESIRERAAGLGLAALAGEELTGFED